MLANKSVLGWSSADLALADPELISPFIRRALDLAAAGTVRPAITGTLPLTEAATAHLLLETRATTGKLLLSPAR